MNRLWIGIDTGGTFTDVVLADIATGEYRYHKLPTTTDDPAKATKPSCPSLAERARKKPSA